MSIGNPLNTGSKEPYTLAVIGDTPYGPAKLAEFPALTDLINGDPKVSLVAHLGDIKAGSSSPCTNEYMESIRVLFDRFKDPFVYTPGDNEWTDCHVASKNNGLYTPTERLAFVRSLFFPVAGQSLGGRKKQLLTEADDRANSTYVENTMWMESQVVFAALNITGSNNDRTSWGTPLPADAANYPSQAAEQVSRAQANRDWLDNTFAIAAESSASAVVLLFQADMWDPTASLSGRQCGRAYRVSPVDDRSPKRRWPDLQLRARAVTLTGDTVCTAGATSVPSRSIARMSFACGREVTFICNEMREIPPSASS